MPTRTESPKESLAQQLFKDKKILTARPPEMSYEEYHLLRKIQNQIIKKLFTHCPDRRLQSILPVKQPTVRVNTPIRRVRTPRKTS